MPLILISNDDGIDAVGLKCLSDAMSPLGDVLIVAPTIQRSGESKSLTFSRPLRVAEIDDKKFNTRAYSVDGTPADTVIIGKYLCNKIYKQNPDLIVSGINSGDNTSVHALLTSGTCAVAFEGALLNIKSIAFSMVTSVKESFFGSGTKTNYDFAAKRANQIADYVIKNQLPEGIIFLNVNFPKTVNDSTFIDVVGLCPRKYSNDVIEAKDPRDVQVFWIWGNKNPNLPVNTDSHSLLIKKNITITPISLDFGKWAVNKLESYFSKLNGL